MLPTRSEPLADTGTSGVAPPVIAGLDLVPQAPGPGLQDPVRPVPVGVVVQSCPRTGGVVDEPEDARTVLVEFGWRIAQVATRHPQRNGDADVERDTTGYLGGMAAAVLTFSSAIIAARGVRKP
ncbi:MAG: hypothetical protein ACRDTE_18195 [Pseudonocardiaceae bacterium]